MNPGEIAIESIGWIATAVFASSYLWKRPETLRRVQALAAVLWVIYGLVIQRSRRCRKRNRGGSRYDFVASATRSDAGVRRGFCDSAAGLVVSRTKLRFFGGSSQQSVPVDPPCPNLVPVNAQPIP